MQKLIANLAAAGLVVTSVAAYAATTPAATDATPQQRQQIEGVVHDYLIKNPEVVVASLQAYQQKQMDQARQTVQKTQMSSPKFADSLFHQATDPVAGNPNGKVTIVEFFDYQCPHCVDMTQTIDDLIKSNPDLRVVFKEFPIRGPMSEVASRAALAANQQGKYFELHKALMMSKQEPLTEDIIYSIAKTVGVDVDKMKAAMKSSSVDQQLKTNYKLAQDLQLMGTPAFFIAKTNVSATSPSSAVVFIPGQVEKSQLETDIQKVNQG